MKKEKVNQDESKRRLLFDFFVWFRENGERLPGTSIEAMIMAGFFYGVKFAQRWISVEEELPEYAGYVLIKNEYGDVSTAFYAKVNEKAKFAIDFEGISSKNVTHWRPIELK
jgi:hypothetical protein